MEAAPLRRAETPRTIRALVDYRAQHTPDKPYLIAAETGRVLTYGELQRQSRLLGRYLSAQGLRHDDKVAILAHNSYQTALLFLGIMYNGMVSVPLNLLSQGAQLAYVLQHSDSRLAFVARDCEQQFAQAVAAGAPSMPAVVFDPDAESLFVDTALPPWKPRAFAAAEPDHALLMYTSGTTGRPKGVVLTHRNIVSGGLFTALAHGLGAGDRVLCSLPLYHINAQIVTAVGPLAYGGSVVMPHRFSASNFWELLARHHCTWFNVVPTIISYLLSAADAFDSTLDLSRIRFGRSASAPLPPELHKAFEQEFGFTIVETFGMTETCAPCFSNALQPAQRKYGSVGRPVGNHARVVGPDGSTLPPGQTGELMVKGDNVMPGYYKDPEITAHTFDSRGWMHTGDLGYMDREGDYFVTGRLKELIIKGGENIAPREIDDVLYKHPAVLEAAVVGIADAHYGQEIMACVVLKPGASVSEDEMRMFCTTELGHYKTPKVIRFVSTLPKGPSGKVQRLKLLDA
jgi:long-chain acyl-CoA synthetase